MTWENRIIFEVSSADPDSTPVWVDLTSRVNDIASDVTWGSGRQNDLEQTEPGRLQLVLDNADDALTYGSTASPYPWFGPGRRCRLRETVAGVTSTRFTGFLQAPTEAIITAGIAQTVSLTAIDRLARLATDDTFVSTVTAHIAASGNGALRAYWPMLDTKTPLRPLVGSLPLNFQTIALTGFAPTTERTLVGARAGTRLLGDDVAPVRITPGIGPDSRVVFPSLITSETTGLSAGQVATVVMWWRSDDPGPADYVVNAITLLHGNSAFFLDRALAVDGGNWHLHSDFGDLIGGVTTGGIRVGSFRYNMLAIRMGYSPNVLELWVDDQVYTGTLSGTVSGSSTVGNLSMGLLMSGSVAHLQLYVGAASDWTHGDFLAQRQVAFYGLARQTTGDRIRAIAKYAGVPDMDIGQIDKGCSIMQAATLAGQDPLAAMRTAETTEQGLLYVDADGRLTFKDRRTLYNI